MLVEGIHFLPAQSRADVAWKLVARNLSDLAAKGAEPLGVLLGYMLGPDDEAFCAGLAEVLEHYGVPLLGGDTVSGGPPQALGLTAVGRAVHRPVPSRGGARPGDALWLTGALGAAMVGFEALREGTGADTLAYRRPMARLAEGQALAPLASAMMDVSDGLLLDLSRLCSASGCGARIDLDALPLSRAFIAERGQHRLARLFAATGGDDYSLLAALPADLDPALSLCLPRGAMLLPIGTLTDGGGISLFDAAGEVPLPERLGYEHHYREPTAPMAGS
jgi:thiamine-monophosphate kinase